MITATEWLSSVRNVGGVRRRVQGRGQRPLHSSRPVCGVRKEILLYVLLCILLYIYYTAYRVSHVNAHPSPLAVLKSYFSTSHVFSGVRLFAYRFRRLSDGIRPYNIVDGTLTSGLRATVPSTFDGTLTDSRA